MLKIELKRSVLNIGFILALMMGIIASLPYGVSFYKDKKNGFINDIIIFR